MKILIGFVERLTSRKFIVAAAAYSIVMLSGLGYAEFPDGVTLAATGALVAYLGVEGGADIMERRNGGG